LANASQTSNENQRKIRSDRDDPQSPRDVEARQETNRRVAEKAGRLPRTSRRQTLVSVHGAVPLPMIWIGIIIGIVLGVVLVIGFVVWSFSKMNW
jgi:hypothetical protein